MAEELNIDTIVGKEPETISDPERTFLTSHKEDLTLDERTKFGIGADPIKPAIREGNPEPPAKPKEGDEDEINPEDRKNIGRVVSEITNPLLKQTQALRQEAEITSYLQSRPDFAKYSEGIRAYMNAHPTLVVADAAKIVAADDLMKIGARREREAQRQVRSTQGGGNSARPAYGGEGKDWSVASKEEVEAKRDEILGRRGN